MVPDETVLLELARLPLVLQISGVQQVVPDFHILHMGIGRRCQRGSGNQVMLLKKAPWPSLPRCKRL